MEAGAPPAHLESVVPPLEPMSSTCPGCGRDLVPVLVERLCSTGPGPVSAEVPVVMRCPVCADSGASHG